MRRTRGRIITVESITELERRLVSGVTRLTGWRIVGLDLRPYAAQLAVCDTSHTTFAGCTMTDDEQRLHAMRGALILPGADGTPIDPHRSRLYRPDELFDTNEWATSLDGRAYAWQQTEKSPDAVMARAMHDDGIDMALTDWVRDRNIVGVMGGHALKRGDQGFRDAALLGCALGQRFTVATGGGPGAMEAANLGASFAGESEQKLDDALRILERTPGFRPSVDEWIRAARDARELAEDPKESLGVPTWHYGHEPPNLFATTIAKYFRNALRESMLLELCGSGIVFLPGAGGTVQEVFQDACENYYASAESISPMVLVGREYWTKTLPVWPLLQALAKGRPMERHVHLVDSFDEVTDVLS